VDFRLDLCAVEVYTYDLHLSQLVKLFVTQLKHLAENAHYWRGLSELLFRRAVGYSESFRASHLWFVVSPYD
jgi:hypothetical protein